MMRYLAIILLIIVGIASYAAPKQPKTLFRTEKYLCFIKKYHVLANDTNVMHGRYQLCYRGKDIESGSYDRGRRIGVWKFYNNANDNYVMELTYDYSRRKPLKIQPHIVGTYDTKNYPSIFLGSPLLPSYFISAHATYPEEVHGEDLNKKVVIALHINSSGKMTGYHYIKESTPDINKSITHALEKIPKDWEWLPARKNGINVASDYIITIIVEAVV
ncbi:MAG: hypothetical protein HUJ96_00450 [Marinilabiliaceae bacterium]|nr:hypothetical protein [Marinilabiliaceae bacterium]